jgi:hypothetical protein
MVEILQIIGTTILFVGACFLPILLIAFGIPMVNYILKRRGARRKKRQDRQHASKFPYRFIAYLFLTITLVAAGFIFDGFIRGVLNFSDDLNGVLAMLLVPLIIAIINFRYYVLQKMPSAAEAIEKDPRPSVLYLRSFNQESLKFVDLKKEERAKYNDYLNYADDVQLPAFEKTIFNLMNISASFLSSREMIYGEDITFEKYFRAEVMERIGPLVALGNPIDELPAEGAFRDYQIDERWKDVFYERADKCACILMQLGNSDNLQFELTSIIGRGLRQKLFVITPPQENVKDKNAWIRKYILCWPSNRMGILSCLPEGHSNRQITSHPFTSGSRR